MRKHSKRRPRGTKHLTISGVSNIDDDLPFGAEQLVVQLTPQGRQLDLSSQQLARQLRGAFEGRTFRPFMRRN